MPISDRPIEPIVRNAWYIAAWGNEVTEKPLARKLLGEDVVLFRDAGGGSASWKTGAATGPRRSAPGSPEGQRFYRDICDAFLEDKAVIETQQAAISRDPERGLHYRRHDEAVARRALHRMSAAE